MFVQFDVKLRKCSLLLGYGQGVPTIDGKSGMKQ